MLGMGQFKELENVEEGEENTYRFSSELDDATKQRGMGDNSVEQLVSENPMLYTGDNVLLNISSHSLGLSNHGSTASNHLESISTLTKEYSLREQIVGYVCLLLAIMSGSLIGPMFRYIQDHGITPVLAASWRCQCMSIILIPLALLERTIDPTKRVQWFKSNAELRGPIIFYVVLAGLGWAGNLLLWVSALRYTTVVRAGLAASMHPIFLIGYLRCRGQSLSYYEWIGTWVTMLGLFVAAAKDVLGGGGFEGIFGDLLGCLSAVCQVMVILNRHKIKKYVPLWQYSAVTTLLVAAVSAGIHMLVEHKGPEDIFCARIDCVFGWASHQWLLTMAIFALVVATCISGYNYSVQFVSPLVFSTVILIDPAISGFIAWVAALEAAPPLLSWIGGGFIITGVFYVTIGEYTRKLADEGKAAPTWLQYFDLIAWLLKCRTGLAVVSAGKKGYDSMGDNDSAHIQVDMAVDANDFGDMEVMSSVEMSMSRPHHSSSHQVMSADQSPFCPDPISSAPLLSSTSHTHTPEAIIEEAVTRQIASTEDVYIVDEPTGFSGIDSSSHIGIPVQRRISGSVMAAEDATSY